MEREFTNALCNTPLWAYALQVYSQHQADLLRWQNDHGANVNRLLAFAFAWSHDCYVSSEMMDTGHLRHLESLIHRIRAVRRASEGVCRQPAKWFELELEGLHLQLLNTLMDDSGCQPADSHIRHAIAEYEQHLDTKKGTLVPFIKLLMTS